LKAIGGGIKLGTVTAPAGYFINDGYLTTTGYAGHVDNNSTASTATVVARARSLGRRQPHSNHVPASAVTLASA
jgi:hypothetical protein